MARRILKLPVCGLLIRCQVGTTQRLRCESSTCPVLLSSPEGLDVIQLMNNALKYLHWGAPCEPLRVEAMIHVFAVRDFHGLQFAVIRSLIAPGIAS
jgi:hypothetical protein